MLDDLVDHVVGIDPDRDRVTAAVACAKTQGELGSRTFPATARGYRAVQRWADTYTEAGRQAWAIESSGSFGAGLTTALTASGESVIELITPDRGLPQTARSLTLSMPSVRHGKRSEDRTGPPLAHAEPVKDSEPSSSPAIVPSSPALRQSTSSRP